MLFTRRSGFVENLIVKPCLQSSRFPPHVKFSPRLMYCPLPFSFMARLCSPCTRLAPPSRLIVLVGRTSLPLASIWPSCITSWSWPDMTWNNRLALCIIIFILLCHTSKQDSPCIFLNGCIALISIIRTRLHPTQLIHSPDCVRCPTSNPKRICTWSTTKFDPSNNSVVLIILLAWIPVV